MWNNTDVPRSDVPPHPLLIKPSCTQPLYTRSVWHVEECRHTQVRCTPPPEPNLVVQSPSTPGQFDMWKNADIPRSDVPPPLLIKSSCTQPYYTRSVWHVEECRHTQVWCTSSYILFSLNTNSLISFHLQSTVWTHQGTTFKELLSFPIEFAILWVRLTFSKGKKCLKRFAYVHI